MAQASVTHPYVSGIADDAVQSAAGAITPTRWNAAHTIAAGGTNGQLQVNSSGAIDGITPTAATALLNAVVGDSGAGGFKGLVPAPAAGDAAAGKFLKANGTWAVLSGGGDALVANPLSQFAATTSAQLRGVLSDESGTGAALFQNGALGTPVSGDLANCTNLPLGTGVSGVLPLIENPQTGTTYAIVTGDNGKIIIANNAAAQAYSIAQAGTTGFAAGWGATVKNIGAGTVTVTATTSTIGGLASLDVPPGCWVTFWSDGTNYKVLMGGTNIQLLENQLIKLDETGSADGKYSGIGTPGIAGYTQAFGELVYQDPDDSRWEKVDADSAENADGDARGILGMVVIAGTDGIPCLILLWGNIRADAQFPTFTKNKKVFASGTAGAVTHTAPSTTDSVIRVIGSARTADELYFNPSPDYFTSI